MQQNSKNITKYLIVFVVAIFIGLGAVFSMVLFSASEKGTSVSQQISLDNADVSLLKGYEENLIKLEFYNIKEEKTTEYELSLMNVKGKTIEKLNLSITYSFEEMQDYIYSVNSDLNEIYFYHIKET